MPAGGGVRRAGAGLPAGGAQPAVSSSSLTVSSIRCARRTSPSTSDRENERGPYWQRLRFLRMRSNGRKGSGSGSKAA